MNIFLADDEATRQLGETLAACLLEHRDIKIVFFYGDMGMGKTTLVSALTKALPGGEKAETGSPSFTLCNIYPTVPPIAHFDFYRQENGSADESFLDFLEEERHVLLVEWAERLPAHALPPHRLDCVLAVSGGGRQAQLTAHGHAASLLACVKTSLDRLAQALPVVSQ